MDAVIITGCSSGLGLQTAVYLAQRNLKVYATMRDLGRRGELDALAAKRGVSLRVLQLDVTDRASIDAAVGEVVAESGGVYGLVNNAARALRGCVETLDDDEVRALFDTNLIGPLAVTRAVLPHMRDARRGRVLFMSSIAGRMGSYGLGAYCSTKFALEGLAETLDQEIIPFGLRAVLIEPGIVDTPIWHAERRGLGRHALDPSGAYYPTFQRQEEQADVLIGRSRNQPIDIARVVHEALTTRNPKLRYVVGQPASLILALRRYLPGELFDRVYFGMVRRAISS